MSWYARIAALAILCVSLDAYAALDTCTFSASSSCSSATSCTPAPSCVGGEGNLSGADDKWVVGTGTNEQSRITFGGPPTGGTFTLTLNGETTGPIAYVREAACSALETPFACCSQSGDGWCNVGENIRSALEALPSINRGDFALGQDCGGGDTCTITWIAGSMGCANVSQFTCASSLTGGGTCTPSTVTAGVASAGAVVLTITGDVTMGNGPGAGINVRCGSSLVATAGVGSPARGLAITLGSYGLILDYGSASTVKGLVRQTKKSTPAPHAPPWTSADGLMVATSITSCPGAVCGRRRFTIDQTGHIQSADPANPFADEAVTTGGIGIEDVLYFPPGLSHSMDEGYWYDIDAVAAGTVTTIDIDVAQSVTASIGWTLAQKGITQTTIAEDVAVGEGTSADPIQIADGIITADDAYVGWCLYIGEYPYRIKATDDNGATDTITLLRETGVWAAASSGATVNLSTSCHRAGDRFYVASPVRIKSATTGTPQAQQEDTPVTISGNTNWDWVVLEWPRELQADGITGTVDHLWRRDRAQTGEDIRIDDSYGVTLGYLQFTGGPDLDGGSLYADCSAGDDCGAHGIGFSGSIGVTVRGFYRRLGGDDGVWSWDQQGMPSDNRILIMRDQFRLGGVSSMECLSSMTDLGLDVGTVECIANNGDTLAGAARSPTLNAFGSSGTRQPTIGSLFSLLSSGIASNSMVKIANAYYSRIVLTGATSSSPTWGINSCIEKGSCAGDQTARNVLFTEMTNFLVQDWSSTVALGLNANAGCIRLRNGILLDGTFVGDAIYAGADRLIYLAECEDGAVWVDNVGWINTSITDGTAGGNLYAAQVGITEFGNAAAPGSYLENVLFYWPSPSTEPDTGFSDVGGTIPANSVTAGGLAFVNYNGSSTAINISSAAEAQIVFPVGSTPNCHVGNPTGTDYALTIDQDMPVGTIETGMPDFPPHSYVARPGSPFAAAGCGLKGSPGVCTWQPWHQWEDISVRQTCYGAVIEVSPHRDDP